MLLTWRSPAGRGTGLARVGSDVARYGFAPRGAGAAPTATDLRAALYATLLADPGVATVVGARVFPLYRPQSGAMPALTVKVASLPRVLDLDGQSGMGMARVEIGCWANLLSDARAAAEAVRLCLGRVGSSMAGLAVTVCVPTDESDDFGDPQDGSDVRPRSIALGWRVHYREPRP